MYLKPLSLSGSICLFVLICKSGSCVCPAYKAVHESMLSALYKVIFSSFVKSISRSFDWRLINSKTISTLCFEVQKMRLIECGM